MDIDTIGLGEDFVKAIETTVAKCDVLIAVIGNNWVTSKDEHGERRLDNPEDFVRMEIGTALKREIRVIPVLVDGASMPRTAELPDDLKPLVRRNALPITDTSFDGDCQRLAAAIRLVLEKAAAEEQERSATEQRQRGGRERSEAQRGRREEKEWPKQPQPLSPDPVALSTHPDKRKLALLAGAVTSLALVIGLAATAIHYFGSQRQEATTAGVAVQPSLQPTATVAVAIPSSPIGTTPLRKEVTSKSLDNATKDHPWVNSLGMKFVPVVGTQVLFSVWDTRVQDFEVFAKSTGFDPRSGMSSFGKEGSKYIGATWKEPGFSQGPTHPVVGVSWNDAEEFCKWLTKRERSAGDLPQDREYRLPTDVEWSAAVGLQYEVLGATPEEKSGKVELYPWDIPQKRDKGWPPPAGAGNYAGEEVRNGDWPSNMACIEGYNDGYPRTSPVGSFPANQFGLYDMGGNVWQWCQDWYNLEQQSRVWRGASWQSFHPDVLLASYRRGVPPGTRTSFAGFRCVVAAESSR